MKTHRLAVLLAFLLPFLSGGCAIVEGVFKFGFWTGALLLGLLVGLVVYLLGRRRRP